MLLGLCPVVEMGKTWLETAEAPVPPPLRIASSDAVRRVPCAPGLACSPGCSTQRTMLDCIVYMPWHGGGAAANRQNKRNSPVRASPRPACATAWATMIKPSARRPCKLTPSTGPSWVSMLSFDMSVVSLADLPEPERFHLSACEETNSVMLGCTLDVTLRCMLDEFAHRQANEWLAAAPMPSRQLPHSAAMCCALRAPEGTACAHRHSGVDSGVCERVGRLFSLCLALLPLGASGPPRHRHHL